MQPPQPGTPDRARRPALRRRDVLIAGLATAAVAGCSPGSPPAPSATASEAATSPAPPSPAPTTATTSPAETGAALEPSIAMTRGPDITHGPRDRGEIALTFHGQGPLSLARSILDTCARAHAHITVFAVGTWLHDSPAIGHEILAGGHELGNHTWSHQQMKQLTQAQATREAVRGAQALTAAVGTHGWWFRPSGTKASTPTIRAAAEAAGYQRCVSYDVDPEDFRDPGAKAVVERTLAGAQAGSIVSLHFGHAGTAQALPAILDGLHQKGLSPVTLSRLLADA